MKYLTDVLEIRVDRQIPHNEALSALYALLEAVPILDVARGRHRWHPPSYYAANHPSFVMFDSVPGGAGHTLRLGQRLPELFAAARDRVEHCECGAETSCYGCLRSYSNQIWHEVLSRGAAFRVLSRASRLDKPAATRCKSARGDQSAKPRSWAQLRASSAIRRRAASSSAFHGDRLS